MARTPGPTADAPGPEQIVHLAARIEDRVHELREAAARRRGHTPTVIPYTGYGAPGWVRVLCRVLLTKPGVDDKLRYRNIRGWRSFTSVPVNDVCVTVEIDGVGHRVAADRGGVVDAIIDAPLPPGWHSVRISTEHSEVVEAPVFIVDPDAQFGIISDIDDTVMVTALPRPLLAAWNTFVLDEHARRPVAGMAVLYERIARAHPGTPVIYLSTGAWNVAPTLNRFLHRNLYPRGPLLLTDWGPTHDRWFRSGREHKERTLERLAREFPDIRWLLVGDDGQHDEEIYGDFAAAHAEQVKAVTIRQLSTSEAVLAGGRSKAAGHRGGIPWLYAPDGAGLDELLRSAGML